MYYFNYKNNKMCLKRKEGIKMKGLSKFLKNKNTVTILGVLACLVILFVGYNMRINQKTALVTVYYANQTIQPKTLIT